MRLEEAGELPWPPFSIYPHPPAPSPEKEKTFSGEGEKCLTSFPPLLTARFAVRRGGRG